MLFSDSLVSMISRRPFFLTAWAYAHGPEAIDGMVHDIAGYAVLGLTCVGLIVLIPLLNLKFEARASDGPTPTV